MKDVLWIATKSSKREVIHLEIIGTKITSYEYQKFINIVRKNKSNKTEFNYLVDSAEKNLTEPSLCFFFSA